MLSMFNFIGRGIKKSFRRNGVSSFEGVSNMSRPIERLSIGEHSCTVPTIVVKLILNIWLRYINLIGKPNNIDYFIDFISRVSLVSKLWLLDILPQLNLSHSEEDTFAINTQRQLNYAFLCFKRSIRCLKYQITLTLVWNNKEVVRELLPYITDVTDFRLDIHDLKRPLKDLLKSHDFPFEMIESFQITTKLNLGSTSFNFNLGPNGTTKVFGRLRSIDLFLGPVYAEEALGSYQLLSNINSLERLSLSAFTHIWLSDQLSNSICALPNLRHISIKSSTVPTSFLRALARGVQNLTSLKVEAQFKIGSNPTEGDSASEFFADMARPSLKHLELTSISKISGRELTNFLNESNLEYFKCKFRNDESEETLISNTTLRSYSSGFHNQIWSKSSVRQLGMRGSYVDNIETLQCFANHMDSLVHLTLKNVTVPSNFSTLLADFIGSTKILRVLSISKCGINFSLLFGAIGSNRSIRTLWLKKNHIDIEPIKKFFDSNHPTITNFTLLKPKGKIFIESIRDSIIKNTTIVHLNLRCSSKSMPEANREFLRSLFSVNKTILHLDFSWNPIIPPLRPNEIPQFREELESFLGSFLSQQHILSLDLYNCDHTFAKEFKNFYQTSSILKVCPQIIVKI